MPKLTTPKILISLTVAILLSQFVHELTHALFGVLVGADNVQVHFFAANALQGISKDQVLETALVVGSAAFVNLLIGFVALFYFSKLKIDKIWLKYTVFLTTVFSLALGFGYLMFDGIFYVPGGAGDFHVVLDLFEGNLILRLALILIGSVGWVYTLFWTSKKAWQFIENESDKVKTNLKILLLPYLVSSILITILAFLTHPLGLEGGVIVAMQYFFGNSVLFTGFFMSSYWLEFRK